MPHITPEAKSSKRAQQDTPLESSAGPRGVALAPPDYGINFVDRLSADHSPIQRQAATAGERPLTTVGSSSNDTGLPDNLKAGIERLSGFDMSDVRVHYNSSKPTQLRAFAYTQGTDIHVAPGQQRHLPHEAWHVVQQKQGRVQPTFQMKGEKVNDDAGLEHEADVMGTKALQMIHPAHIATDRANQTAAADMPRLNFLSTTLVFHGSRKSDAGNTSMATIQCTKWKWDDSQAIWLNLSDPHSTEDPPDFDGGFDGEVYDDDPRPNKAEEDSTFRGARVVGDSGAVAMARFNRRPKPSAYYKKLTTPKRHPFKTWKKNREAQHLIPASLHKDFPALKNIVDDADNGMMLPATHAPTNTKVTHRKPKYRDHAKYTKNVKTLISKVHKQHALGVTQPLLRTVMEVLRFVNKHKLGQKYKYLDDIPWNVFKKYWNQKHPLQQIN